jgi:hypothetical protein
VIEERLQVRGSPSSRIWTQWVTRSSLRRRFPRAGGTRKNRRSVFAGRILESSAALTRVLLALLTRNATEQMPLGTRATLMRSEECHATKLAYGGSPARLMPSAHRPSLERAPEAGQISREPVAARPEISVSCQWRPPRTVCVRLAAPNVLSFQCANRLRQRRRHWQLAASDDARKFSRVKGLRLAGAGDARK